MHGKIPVTICGNLTSEVELRYTPNAVAVANFSVASNPRVYNSEKGQYEDGQATFLRCRIWRDPAINLAESNLRKGTRVIVHGVLVQRNWEDAEGNKRTSYELDAEDVATSMRFAQVNVKRIDRTAEAPATAGTAASDPWNNTGKNGNGKSQFPDEPPF